MFIQKNNNKKYIGVYKLLIQADSKCFDKLSLDANERLTQKCNCHKNVTFILL